MSVLFDCPRGTSPDCLGSILLDEPEDDGGGTYPLETTLILPWTWGLVEQPREDGVHIVPCCSWCLDDEEASTLLDQRARASEATGLEAD